MNDTPKYLNFPLYLLRELISDKENTLNSIIYAGIYSYSLGIKPTAEKVARQVFYDFYNNRLHVDLTSQLEDIFKDLYIEIDYHFKGFKPGSFGEEEIPILAHSIKNYTAFYSLAEEHFRLHTIKEAAEYLGISIRDTEHLRIESERIMSNAPKNDVFAFVNCKTLFEFRDKTKSEKELVQFATNIAIRSILGKKHSGKTNIDHIKARALGFKSIKEFQSESNKDKFAFIDKYFTRYGFDKLRKELTINKWGLIFYTKQNMRGLYTGRVFKGETLDEALERVITSAEEAQMKYKVNELKRKTNATKIKVQKKLFGEMQN